MAQNSVGQDVSRSGFVRFVFKIDSFYIFDKKKGWNPALFYWYE